MSEFDLLNKQKCYDAEHSRTENNDVMLFRAFAKLLKRTEEEDRVVPIGDIRGIRIYNKV